jgi:hypothetical protein
VAYVIFAVLLVGVVWLVSAPLRQRSSAGEPREGVSAVSLRRSDLEAARDAKYREIRDAELDHQTGKLSDADYAAIDTTLRAEAVELLHELDALKDENPQLDRP